MKSIAGVGLAAAAFVVLMTLWWGQHAEHHTWREQHHAEHNRLRELQDQVSLLEARLHDLERTAQSHDNTQRTCTNCPKGKIAYHGGSHCCNEVSDHEGQPLRYASQSCKDDNLIECPSGAVGARCPPDSGDSCLQASRVKAALEELGG